MLRRGTSFATVYVISNYNSINRIRCTGIGTRTETENEGVEKMASLTVFNLLINDNGRIPAVNILVDRLIIKTMQIRNGKQGQKLSRIFKTTRWSCGNGMERSGS